jgi:diapolycopene oxygenase
LTIYLVVPRTDLLRRGSLPKNLPHIPHIEDAHPLTRKDYLAFKERVVDKLERMGLKDLRKHVVFEHCWTPLDIRQQYYSNKGAIYGVVSDRFKNLAFKAPKQSTKYPNLFFVGSSQRAAACRW